MWTPAETGMDEEECDCADRAPRDEYWICPKCGAEWFPEDEEWTAPEPEVVGQLRRKE